MARAVRRNKRHFCFTLDLPVRNEWGNIEVLRASVRSCLSAIFNDMEGCDAIAMIAGELLENAMKYGAWDEREKEACFRLRVEGDERRTTVEVQNPVRPGDPEVGHLLRTLEWIRSFPGAEQAYRARLLAIAADAEEENRSELGLVRVAYEGACQLAAEVEEDVLTVVAVR